MLQGRIHAVHKDGIPVEIDELVVRRAPGIGPPVVRVREADNAGLVPVVDGRGPGPGHLQNRGRLEDGLVHALAGGG